MPWLGRGEGKCRGAEGRESALREDERNSAEQSVECCTWQRCTSQPKARAARLCAAAWSRVEHRNDRLARRAVWYAASAP